MTAQRLAGGIDSFVDVVGRATAWLTLGLALVMGSNVLLRYGFSVGSIWMQEFEWHVMVPICVFGMSYALLHGEHVRVDVLFQYFSVRNKHLIEVTTAILGMLLGAIVIKLSLPYVYQSWSINEGTANPGGIDARYIVKGLIPLGFALYLLQSLSNAIKSYIAYRRA
jgi:TRAP-type mannitol/chloroaromatic compound transport system permease small subunit